MSSWDTSTDELNGIGREALQIRYRRLRSARLRAKENPPIRRVLERGETEAAQSVVGRICIRGNNRAGTTCVGGAILRAILLAMKHFARRVADWTW